MSRTKLLLFAGFILLLIVLIINIQKSKSTIPWPVETNNLKARLNNINLPALPEEGNVLHTHQHLDIYIDSNHLTIPANIGINESENFIAPIHTHDTTGIIHIESPTVETYTLGQFFDIWGIKFDDNCINIYCTNANKKLILYSNGQLIQNNFYNLKLEPYQEIVIVYGTPPSSIPSTYDFPLDY